MFNKVAFKGAKRQKELARLKKVEEKRQRRLAKRDGSAPDAEGDADEEDAVGDEDPAVEVPAGVQTAGAADEAPVE